MNQLGIVLMGLVVVIGLLVGCTGSPPANYAGDDATGQTGPGGQEATGGSTPQYASNSDIQEDITAADGDSSDAELSEMDPSTVETTDSELSESDLEN